MIKQHHVTPMTEKINLTPRWVDIVPAIIYQLQNSDELEEEDLNCLKQELVKMAKAADFWNNYIKTQQNETK